MGTVFDFPNTSLIFWQLISFAVLLYLLYRYVYPPIRDRILQRQQQIEQAIDEAERTRAEAQELLTEYRKQIGEGRRILEESRKQGEAQLERAKTEAREESNRIIQRSREEIERERDAALQEVRQEVAEMVIQASEQVLGRTVDRGEHERLISSALDDLDAELASGAPGSGR
jgi:F-type H+-transporting ATPase subunit b